MLVPVNAVLTVRVATDRDAEAAVEVLRRSITELCFADHQGDAATLEGWLANKTPRHFRNWLSREGQYTVIAARDSTVCGVGMLAADGGVRLCYVHPEHTRLGVGRALVMALETEAKARGLTRLHLDSTLSAQAFYEALGFHRAVESTDRSNPYDKLLVP